jgi:hypothetical protein
MKWVFSAFVIFWNLRAIEGPASADLWPNDVFHEDYTSHFAQGDVWRLRCFRQWPGGVLS